MEPLFLIVSKSGPALDALGILGLGLTFLAALRLARRDHSAAGAAMAAGAAALLLGRMYFMLAPHLMDRGFLDAAGPVVLALMIGVPPLLVSFGMAGVAWGLWGHERGQRR